MYLSNDIFGNNSMTWKEYVSLLIAKMAWIIPFPVPMPLAI